MYASGRGVEQDYGKAKQWYQKAAEQGNAKAKYNLGVMYAIGQGLRQDYAKAKSLYEEAAAQGDTSAQYNLGVFYYKGYGVRQNTAAAKEWFGKACDNGFQKGCDAYARLNRRCFFALYSSALPGKTGGIVVLSKALDRHWRKD